MAKRDLTKKEDRRHEEDDGRTIADMSGIGRPGVFGWPAGGDMPSAGGVPGMSEDGASGRGHAAQKYEQPLTKKERLLCALGALKAALLIGLAYIVGLGLVIALLLFLWK